MKKKVIAGLIILLSANTCTIEKAVAQGTFKGRIAWSADGNFNDEDDWAASPLALAIFARSGMKDRLVHFDYNCILPETDKNWEANHKESVLGAARLMGFDPAVFYDCRENKAQAIESIVKAVDASSEEDPLYFILAGPMEIPFLGLSLSDPDKRKYVYCISHSNWNDGYASGDLIEHNKRDIIPTGVTWIQIADQNQWLNTSVDGARAIYLDPAKRKDGDRNWKPWWWMRDSDDPVIKFVWERLQTETRPDASDAGMAYFLMTGDEQAELYKIRNLLERSKIPERIRNRKSIRMEAENFSNLDGFNVDYINERICSQRISVKYTGKTGSQISTEFREIMVEPGNTYDITIHYYCTDSVAEFGLYINGARQGDPWHIPDRGTWQIAGVGNVKVNPYDQIVLRVKNPGKGEIKVDYLELTLEEANNPFKTISADHLDNPGAMPGQLIVKDKTMNNPGYLAYNGAGPAFLCGPDNPETFLWFGNSFNSDGTVADRGQEEMIRALAGNNVNAIHFQMFRMKKCNYKDEGDDRHAPFIGNDPSKGLNQAVLDQWDAWLDRFEENGIAVHLEFYNDATDVESMGWKPAGDGSLHPGEYRFIKGIVERFKHHRNILWGIGESANKLDRGQVKHFREIARVIAEADNFDHPVVQSFVVRNDPEGDFHTYSGLPDDYIGDPNIDIVTWLHVPPHGNRYDQQYVEYRQLYDIDHNHFIVQKNETFHHPLSGKDSRIYMWACTMTGTHCLEAYHHANDPAPGILFEDGLISTFMEQTDYQYMEPRNDLKLADSNWILASPGRSYIVYSYDCSSEIGLKQMTDGVYKLVWMDTRTGETVTRYNVSVSWGDNRFKKPSGLGSEVVVYIRNTNLD